MIKNTAGQVVSAHLVSKTDGSDITSGTTTVYVTKDNGTQAAGAGAVAHKGNGSWSYAPTQAETNASHIVFTFVNATAISVDVQVYTVGQDFGATQLAADVVRVGGNATAATTLRSYLDGTDFMPVDAYKPNFSVVGTTLEVKKPDGTTTAYTKTVATDPNADPVTGAS